LALSLISGDSALPAASGTAILAVGRRAQQGPHAAKVGIGNPGAPGQAGEPALKPGGQAREPGFGIRESGVGNRNCL